MIKKTIGRNAGCDIVIKDTTDVISRWHAIITFSFWARMYIFDTSQNGTYVNGQRVPQNTAFRIRRGDKIEFAHIRTLDWQLIKDPYRSLRITLVSCIAVFLTVLIVVGGLSVTHPEFFKPQVHENLHSDKNEQVVNDNNKEKRAVPTKPAAGSKRSRVSSLKKSGTKKRARKSPVAARLSEKKGEHSSKPVERKSMLQEKSPMEYSDII